MSSGQSAGQQPGTQSQVDDYVTCGSHVLADLIDEEEEEDDNELDESCIMNPGPIDEKSSSSEAGGEMSANQTKTPTHTRGLNLEQTGRVFNTESDACNPHTHINKDTQVNAQPHHITGQKHRSQVIPFYIISFLLYNGRNNSF